MKTFSAFAATLCVASFSAHIALAQSAPHSTDAPAASALTYESPLAGFVPLKEPVVSPASTWRAVNRAVGSYDSMSATMDDMPGMAMPAGHDMKSMPMDHNMKSMPMKQDKKPMPKAHDMKSMPMDHDMKMNMDSMPGMKMEGK